MNAQLIALAQKLIDADLGPKAIADILEEEYDRNWSFENHEENLWIDYPEFIYFKQDFDDCVNAIFENE